MLEHKEFENYLSKAGVCGLKHVRTVESNVTLAWGVKWDDFEVARDIIQNFYDANREHISQISVTVERDQLEISAPATFDLNQLYFMGSEKDSTHVGQYGEGFKAAAVSYLRQPGRHIMAASNDQALVIVPSKQPIAGTKKLFPLVYHFFACEPVQATRLVLANCPESLSICLVNGMENFYYPEHPRLGKLLRSNGRIAMFRSTGENGCVFYRNLKRGELPGIPLVFVFERAYAAIEKKIGADRDRKEFGADLREFFLKQIDCSLLSGDTFAQQDVIEACRSQWEQGTGNQLLQIMSRGATWTLKVSAPKLFGDGFFSHSKPPDNHAARLQHEQITRQWKSDGKIELPGYFARFGVVTVETHVKQLEETVHAVLVWLVNLLMLFLPSGLINGWMFGLLVTASVWFAACLGARRTNGIRGISRDHERARYCERTKSQAFVDRCTDGHHRGMPVPGRHSSHE